MPLARNRVASVAQSGRTEIPASGLRCTGTGRPVRCGRVAHDNRGVVTGLSGSMLVYDKVEAVALDEGAPHGRWLGVTLPPTLSTVVRLPTRFWAIGAGKLPRDMAYLVQRCWKPPGTRSSRRPPWTLPPHDATHPRTLAPTIRHSFSSLRLFSKPTACRSDSACSSGACSREPFEGATSRPRPSKHGKTNISKAPMV